MEELNSKFIDKAIDLSISSSSKQPLYQHQHQHTSAGCNRENQEDEKKSQLILKPIPIPPWSTQWYQNLWTNFVGHNYHIASDKLLQEKNTIKKSSSLNISENIPTFSNIQNLYSNKNERIEVPLQKSNFQDLIRVDGGEMLTPIIDVACCDGPVKFEKICNPNFALTVEHLGNNNPSSSNTTNRNNENSSANMELKTNRSSSRTYICIYCNQNFKSLFCYQKHKKRHLNPVSVDIATNIPSENITSFDNKTKMRDINVQFFPCKKCGSKFPSYYFVHKHKRTCQ